MPLYEIKPDRINALDATTFAEVGLRERADIQRLLRDQIKIIAPDTLIIAEEFGDWEDSRRRIDLLGLDTAANLVVIELKRTEDGGHMDLQALRYAAMVSTMTFDQATKIYGAHLRRFNNQDDPRTTMLSFLGWDEPDELQFASQVRIVLASAEFSRELTTAVLWLNDQGLDIRCVRLRPYRYEDCLLLDVQQLLPLPEAAEYQISVREKVQRAARPLAGSRDYTRYNVTTAAGIQANLPKGRTVLAVVRGLMASGVPVTEIQEVLQSHHRYGIRTVIGVAGDVTGADFVASIAEHSAAEGRALDSTRYFTGDSELLRSGTHTFALTNQWGVNVADTLKAMAAAFPNRGVSYEVVAADV